MSILDFSFNNKCLIIAEACDNHMGCMETAIEMCNQAKLSGADIIKFQHHLADEEMLEDSPMSDNFDEPLYDFLKKNALSLNNHKEIKNHCESIGITYLCTPFSYKAAVELMELDVCGFKIGSGEMTDIPSLIKIADLGKPMILSTGMSTLDEIDATYNALKDKCNNLSLLNCVSEYPPVYEDINLNVINVMQDRYPEATIGHSDHTPDLYTCFAATALGAKIIEKHVILDKKTPGPDQSVSIDFMDLKNLVDGIRKIELSLGDEKSVHSKEKQIREWAFRSIVTTAEIKAGDVFCEENLWTKRPGTGIPSAKLTDILGKIAKNDIEINTLLKEEDIS
jgi:sialic acid synthase SpsE